MREINLAIPVMERVQRCVVAKQFNNPQVPSSLEVLAKSPELDKPLYYSGVILGKYTDIANCPDNNPNYLGTYMRYDPKSTNPDVSNPVAIISEEFLNGAQGWDALDGTNTFIQTNVTPLLSYNVFLYGNTVVEVNSADAVEGMAIKYHVTAPYNIKLNGKNCPVLFIQGVTQ